MVGGARACVRGLWVRSRYDSGSRLLFRNANVSVVGSLSEVLLRKDLIRIC